MRRSGHPRLFLLAALLIATQPACSLTYSADPIEAWVIDAETKQPLEGVVVTANWELTGGYEGHYPKGQMMVMETLTDKDGRFHFPGWGPKVHIGLSKLRENQPQLILFKPGYRYQILQNTFKGNQYSGKWEWSGKKISFQPFKGTMEEYARYLSFLMTGLRFIEDDCQWKKTPRMLIALQQQADAFAASGIVSDIYRVDFLPTDEKKCGSVKEYFRRYQR